MFDKLIKQWKDEAKCKGIIQYKYSYSTSTLKIFTPYPGYLIGGEGKLVSKYTLMFKAQFGVEAIEFIETDLRFVK